MPCRELTTSLPSSLYKSSAVPLSHNGNHARPLPLHGRGGGPALSLTLSVSPPRPAAAVRLVLRPWASPTAGGGGRGGVAGAVPKRGTNLWAAMDPPRPAGPVPKKQTASKRPKRDTTPSGCSTTLKVLPPQARERRRGPFIPSYLRAETWATSPRQRLDDAGAGRAGGRRGPVEREDRDRRRTGLSTRRTSRP